MEIPVFSQTFSGETSKATQLPQLPQHLAAHGAAVVHTGAQQIDGGAHPADEDRCLVEGARHWVMFMMVSVI